MAAIGSIRLAVQDGTPQSGAAFRLNEPSKACRTLIVDAARIELGASNPYIVASLAVDHSPA